MIKARGHPSRCNIRESSDQKISLKQPGNSVNIRGWELSHTTIAESKVRWDDDLVKMFYIWLRTRAREIVNARAHALDISCIYTRDDDHYVILFFFNVFLSLQRFYFLEEDEILLWEKLKFFWRGRKKLRHLKVNKLRSGGKNEPLTSGFNRFCKYYVVNTN